MKFSIKQAALLVLGLLWVGACTSSGSNSSGPTGSMAGAAQGGNQGAQKSSGGATSGGGSSPHVGGTGGVAANATGGAGGMRSSGGAAGSSVGGATGGAGPSAPVTFAEYCDAAGRLYAAWLAACYPGGYDAANFAEWVSTCLGTQPSLTANKLSFDGAAAANCLDQAKTRDCGTYGFLGEVDACQAVFKGKVAANAACNPFVGTSTIITSSECAAGYCAGEPCASTCVAYNGKCDPNNNERCAPSEYCDDAHVCHPRLIQGAACNGNPSACATGLDCVGADGNKSCTVAIPEGGDCTSSEACAGSMACAGGKCRVLVASGQPCLQSMNCPAGETCIDLDGFNSGAAGTCGAPHGLDEACSGSIACADALYCDGSSVCKPRSSLDADCSVAPCDRTAFCSKAPAVCKARIAENADCTAYADPDLVSTACQAGLLCMADGKCHPRGNAEGAPCPAQGPDGCLRGLYCASGACTPQKAGGVACTDVSECLSFSCDQSKKCVDPNACQ